MTDRTPIAYHGTPIEIMTMFLYQAGNKEKYGPEEGIASGQTDGLFMMFEEGFKHMDYDEQLRYIDTINSVFLEIRKKQPQLMTHDVAIQFQLELFRWSSYWRGVISYKKTRKPPDFGLDLEHIQSFASNFLFTDRRVKYVKKIYERIIKDYKYGTDNLAEVKQKLKEMIEDFELIAENDVVEGKKGKKSSIDKDYGAIGKEMSNSKDKSEAKDLRTAKDLKPYMTSSEAMHMLGVKKTKFYELKRQGIINPTKMGARKNLYRTEEILEYLKSLDKK